nr:unnamed protein product [Spirometra erinaceieuropaei]
MPRYQSAFRSRVGFVGRLGTQSVIYPPMSISSPTFSPAANPAPIGTAVTDDRTIAASPPPSALSQRLHRPQRPAPRPRLHAHPPLMGRRLTSNQLQPSPTSPPAARGIRSIPALIAIAYSLHAPVWSVTCESIAQRLANRGRQHTLAAPA